jgi:hypothetical protein
LYIITIDGKLKRKVQIHTILASLYDIRFGNPTTTIFSFSDTGELLHQFDIVGEYRQLLSHHTNGHILLVKDKEAIMLQM